MSAAHVAPRLKTGPPLRTNDRWRCAMSDEMDDLPLEARNRAISWLYGHEARILRLFVEDPGGAAYPPTGSDIFHPDLWKAPHWRWFKASLVSGIDRAIKLQEDSKVTRFDKVMMFLAFMGAMGGLLY